MSIIKKLKFKNTGYKTLSCGCKIYQGKKVLYYVGKIMKHVMECEKAQKLLIEKRKK